MTEILIIGAGVAGMAAAEHLVAAGYTPRVVDQAARPGGRCATGAAADSDWFDYGAQYVTARNPDFRRSVTADLRAGRLTRWAPTIASAEQIGPTWLLTPSPDARERLIGPRGLNSWVRERLAAAGVDVATEKRIVRTAGCEARWRFDYEDNSIEHADSVICTPPAAQTAALLGTHATRIDALARADTALAACHCVVVRAPALAEHQAIFFESGRLAWAADNSHKAARDDATHLWTLHADTQFSQANSQTPATDLADTLTAEFAAATAQRPEAMQIVHSHRWHAARPASGAPDADDLCWADTAAGLAIAGDWLAGGRIEGAWLSGREAARRLIAADTRA